jgi:hypothetical protein
MADRDETMRHEYEKVYGGLAIWKFMIPGENLLGVALATSEEQARTLLTIHAEEKRANVMWFTRPEVQVVRIPLDKACWVALVEIG